MSDRRQNGSAEPESDSGPASLLLETLGGAALVAAGPSGPRTAIFGPSKPLALIAYLASVPGHSATREFLIDLLWADLDPDAARHAFRQTLWYIKQKVGHSLIRASGDTITLSHEIPSDRGDFLRAVERQDFETAVSLYHGDFLPDLAAPGGLQFEHWADLERQRLRDTFTRAAEHVVRHCLATARHRDAVALARRTRDLDPLNERAWRLLLESLISANDALGASMEADALQKLLADEGREAEPATRSLLRTARQIPAESGADAAKASGIVAELVGRETEFSTLLAAWDEARAGVARKVCIIGSAGIGKTRLVTDIAARLRATRARVVWVRANPGERDIAYAFLSKLAGALATLPGAAAVSPASASALVALNPTLSSSFSAAADRAVGPDALRHRTIAVHELLAAAADEAPVAVIVDDLHWADRESARAFAGLSDRLDHERVLLISATRPANGSGAEIPRDATVIRLAPLTVAETGALLASVAALPQSAVAQQLPSLVREVSGGNPLLTIETLQFLLDQQSLRLERETWLIADERVVLQALNAGGALRRRIDNLDPGERSVLNAVAISGVPVPAGFIADVVQRPLPDVAAVLHGLETRGMVAHLGGGWEPAHDQIGEIATQALGADRRSAMELAVARAWLHDRSDDRALRRAGVHFLRGGDRTGVADAFATWTRLVRRSGDRRPGAALASEFLDRENEALVHQLVRSLPLQHRFGWARWRAAATIAFVAVASAAATWRWTRQPESPPDEILLAVAVDSAGDTTTYRVPIRRDQWTAPDVLIPSREGRPVHVALPATLADYILAADGKGWYSHAPMPDSGGNDLVLDRLSGGAKRLTWNPGDDGRPDLSPDGKRLLFLTGRFDSLGHAHVATMDLATGRVQQLTGGGSKDASARWSQDGLRIAFDRISLTDAPDSVCTMAPNGEDSECRPTAQTTQVLGWIDDDRVLLSRQTSGGSALDVYDVVDGSSRRVFHAAWGTFDLSPDGRWVVCRCRETSNSPVESVVFPLDHPELARTVADGPLDTRLTWTLWMDRRPADYVNALALSVPASGVQLGVAYRFPLTGITMLGRRILLPYAALASLDPSVVRVLPGLRLLPTAAGNARIVISAIGWRTDTVTMHVVSGGDSVVLRDDWSQGLDRRFVPYGVPAPTVVTDGSGRPAFSNNGDGDFTSGVYTRARLGATGGLGVEALVSAPVNSIQWQTEDITLYPVRDSAALEHWDRKTGYPPFETGTGDGECSFSYPSDEGTRGTHTAYTGHATVDLDSFRLAPLNTGRWFRVRLQIFSDGRCGVAVDGHPVALSPTGRVGNAPYVAAIEGSSVHTRILAGPVEIWTGIKPGVDWLAFDTAHAAPKPPPLLSRGARRWP